jgi:hypothetical protein
LEQFLEVPCIELGMGAAMLTDVTPLLTQAMQDSVVLLFKKK